MRRVELAFILSSVADILVEILLFDQNSTIGERYLQN